jgi:hypothetical protein
LVKFYNFTNPLKEASMFANLYSTARSEVKDIVTRARRYDDPEIRLQMSKLEQDQNAATMFVLPTLLAASIIPAIAWMLVPEISKLMGLPTDASIFATPVIPVVLAIVLVWAYIGQRIMLRRVNFSHLAFVTVITFIGAYGGWAFYLLKLKVDANPGFLG